GQGITGANGAASPFTGTPPTPTEQIRDGGFESNTNTGTNPNWTSTSTAYGSSLCTITFCGTNAPPRTGNGWVWFDGTGMTAAENGMSTQTVTLPAGGTAVLSYWMRVSAVTAPSTSVMRVMI